MSQSRTVLSLEPAASSRPSSEKATEVTQSEWPSRVCCKLPVTVSQLTDHQAGLVCSVKAVERSTIEAAASGSRDAALRAFAWHPLIDSVTDAGKLLDAYAGQLPDLARFRA